MKYTNNDERGFILVTSLILLSILTILGAVSFFKSNIEIKVSRSSLEAEQAFAAMNVGLSKIYANWVATPAGEFKTLADLVGTGGTASGIYVNVNSITVAALGGNPPAAARVYTLAANGSLGTVTGWGTGNDPQVAVWVTSFKPQTGSAYPYVQWNDLASGCSDCGLVVYALGRSGDARRLGREYMSTMDSTIQPTGAMINAPAYKTLAGRCDNNPAAGAAWGSSIISGGSVYTHMIDATQSPGGVAMASNNGVNIANSSKPYPGSTGTSLKGIDPWVMYDPGKVAKVDYPKVGGNKMSAISATVVRENLNMEFFSNPDAQLFNLDVYREAANRIAGFSGETFTYPQPDGTIVTKTITLAGAALNGLGNYTVLKDGGTLNGVPGHLGNSGHARMGTIQWPDVQYNINNGIPMYGLVRIMIPMVGFKLKSGGDPAKCAPYPTDATKYDGANSGDCVKDSAGGKLIRVSCGSTGVDKFAISFKDMPPGRLIVYGAALFDFFYDKDGDNLYEPALLGVNKEVLLTPTEALISKKLNVDTHIAFNPVMDGNVPRSGSGTTLDAAGVPGILEINTYPNDSPSWNLDSDKMTAGDGAMDIMDQIWTVGKNWPTKVYDAGAYQFTNFAGWGLSANQVKMLDYYIRTTANASSATWSHSTVAAIEANHASFYIDSKADLEGAKPSSADLFHSFLPSGYIHGWKRAMAVSGLAGEPAGGTSDNNKTIWSEDLLPTGSQFHDERYKYFSLTRDDAASKVYIDKDFSDLPAEMYAGGLLDMHQHANSSGVLYTPDQLELELKQTHADAYQYLNGLVITGAGVYMKDETSGAGRAIIVYDDTSIDNLPTNNVTLKPGRKYWQELK